MENTEKNGRLLLPLMRRQACVAITLFFCFCMVCRSLVFLKVSFNWSRTAAIKLQYFHSPYVGGSKCNGLGELLRSQGRRVLQLCAALLF